MEQTLKFIYLPTNAIVEKKSLGWLDFWKSYIIIRVGYSMFMLAYKVGGWGEKRPKICLRNTWMGSALISLDFNFPRL